MGKSLKAMKIHALVYGVKHISMAMIGCGLDKLSWSIVRNEIIDVFQSVKIEN
jgi:hypothetical protein